jgi:hypothetical protein
MDREIIKDLLKEIIELDKKAYIELNNNIGYECKVLVLKDDCVLLLDKYNKKVFIAIDKIVQISECR